jgi:replicative DNA helicase
MGYSCRSGLYSLFFSLEMPDEKIFEREMQIANGITGNEVEYRINNNSPITLELTRQCKASGSDKLLTIERPKLTLEQITEYVELAKLRYEIGVIGIDYLGLMKGASGRSSADLTEDMSNGAKELAKEVRLPVILLTQINRAAAKAQADDGTEIELHHLKYGGEAGADIVLGLYKDSEESLVLKILKSRGGITGKKYKADITASALRFDDFSEYVSPPKSRRSKGASNEPPCPF